MYSGEFDDAYIQDIRAALEKMFDQIRNTETDH